MADKFLFQVTLNCYHTEIASGPESVKIFQKYVKAESFVEAVRKMVDKTDPEPYYVDSVECEWMADDEVIE